MPDPKLKEAAEEIKAILRKHDIVGVVHLHSEISAEYIRHLEASWSILKFEPSPEPGAVGLRFRCKRADFATKEEWEKAMKTNIGLLCGMVDLMRNDTEAMTVLLQEIGKRVIFEHVSRHE